jgi:hypothetical protein
LNSNSDGNAIVSPIKIIKVTDKYNSLQESFPSRPPSTISSNIDNLLSTKQLEPVQVHSVVSKVGQQTKQEKCLTQSVVKTLINLSPSSKLDEIKFVIS